MKEKHETQHSKCMPASASMTLTRQLHSKPITQSLNAQPELLQQTLPELMSAVVSSPLQH